MEQWTINFQNTANGSLPEQAVVQVRFSPSLFEELIQFDVELNSIPITDKVSKDVIVNWKMYDGFDPKGEFYTDSNGLEMVKRIVNPQTWFDYPIFRNRSELASNYYPIDSAIAMRDKSDGKLQVTIMNDRPQGGSADLSDKASIEIMQNRRQVTIDKTNDFDETLNETDSKTGQGHRISAQYHM